MDGVEADKNVDNNGTLKHECTSVKRRGHAVEG